MRWAPQPERFLALVQKTPDCWLWKGHVARDGYGRHGRIPGTRSPERAHRRAFRLFVGDPDGLQIHHACGNPLCVNPDHLVPLDQEDHTAAHRDRADACINGHAWTDDNTRLTRDGKRRCRACEADRGRRRRAENPDYFRRIEQARWQRRKLATSR